MKSCIETDKQALLKLKNGFVDEWKLLSSWRSEVDCCQWNGISCNNLTGHVIKLDLQAFNYTKELRGNIDSSLCDLQHLIHLNLSLNDFEGSKIPKCIGSLGQLKELILSDASIGGSIPQGLQNLSNLQTLNLGYNYDLIANNLEWISNLSSLRHLDLSGVNLTLAIHWQSSLSSKTLFQLKELILSYSALVGIFSHKLQNLSNLQTLNLRGNYNLIVNDLKWISQLSSLRYLDLSGINLSQAIDWQSSLSSITPFQLRGLILSRSSLSGIFSHELLNLSNLQTLDLSGNYNLIANDFEWISLLSSLRYLDLSRINLSQAIDWKSSLLSKVPSLFALYLDGCALSQVNLKSFFHINSSTSLNFLSLASNFLDSSILSWVSNVSKVLAHLDLSTNSLQHIAPDAFTNTTSLEVLNLSNNKLESSMVKSISSLCRLKKLILNSNNFSSQLSDWISQLCCAQYSIKILDLNGNPFSSGPFPDFSRFSSLVTLNLMNTSIRGPIPQSFGHLPNLSDLDLSYNNLSGPLPKFARLLSLYYLDLSNNQLNGILPSTFEQLPSLNTLLLSSNKLNCVISEAYLSSLSSLKFLDVSYNLISFKFNSNWVPPFQLKGFFASSCSFGPDFPIWLKFQKELTMLDISDNAISDSIPQWFWLSPSLAYLNLSHNKIYGELPKSLLKIKINDILDYYVWDLSFNNLSGPLPHFPPNAAVLLLSNNMFSGSISSFCSTLQSILTFLDMSSNLLSGRLPDCWGQFPFLRVLNLANNNFLGTIPNSIGTLKDIETIHFNNNKFSGKIPSLMNSPNLQFIDFGQNNLNGKLPSWIGHHLLNLIGLHLQANKLQGSIPTSLCNLPLLQILDLSQNNIIGIIPQCFNNLSALSNLTFPRTTLSYYASVGFIVGNIEVQPLFIDNAMLAWKGEYVEYGKNLGLMTTIDLSCNHLKGEIPSSIITLMALASLNLSRNNLTGFIPNNMGQMKMLESLDLSINSLFGEIPISFSALSFLSVLNLSFNNLSGEIPLGTQLQTFNASSYIGNQGLCGLPLTKGCPGDGSSYAYPVLLTMSSHNIDGDENDKLISFGFYVSMVFGFIVGFWGVYGTLILKSSWRHAFFQFFINMNNWAFIQIVVFNGKIKRRFQD